MRRIRGGRASDERSSCAEEQALENVHCKSSADLERRCSEQAEKTDEPAEEQGNNLCKFQEVLGQLRWVALQACVSVTTPGMKNNCF